MTSFRGSRSVAWAALVVAASMMATTGTAQEDASRPLPPHDYSLVVPGGGHRAATGLARVEQGLYAALADSKALRDGFPEAGVVVRRPSGTDGQVVRGSCDTPSQPGQTRDSRCIRLGPESYVELGTVDFPDSRVYLFEVFLFDKPPRQMLDRAAAFSMTRITVHHPVFRGDVTGRPGHRVLETLAALQRGLLLAGARPMLWKQPD